MKFVAGFFSLCLLVIVPTDMHAAYILKNGKLYKKDDVATLTVGEHYSLLMTANEKKNWEEMLHQSEIITKNFDGTPFADEANFYKGVAFFYLQDYEFANKEFSSYLKKISAAKHFEDAITYKFEIAEKFRTGSKRHLLGWKKMPKLIHGKEHALKIYDEVIMALPNHDLAAQSLFGKAEILLQTDDFRNCIETYQTLIRRFPKHRLAPESYLGIGQVYLKQCRKQYPDPDFLDLAEINLKKFKLDFPGESRHKVAEAMLKDMKEVYAKALYDIAEFYERTKKKNAAYIYYSQIAHKYEGTEVAEKSNERIAKLQPPPALKEEEIIVKEEEASDMQEQEASTQDEGKIVHQEEMIAPSQEEVSVPLKEDGSFAEGG